MPAADRKAERPRKSRHIANSPEQSDIDPTSRQNFASDAVQARIRQWQDQGAARALAPDEVSLWSPPASDVGNDKPLSPDLEKKPTEGDRTPTRKPERFADRENRQWVRDIESASTPRKRVISDEHWKAKRGEKQYSPQSVPTARGADSDVFRIRTDLRGEREERRRRREAARDFLRKDDEARYDNIRISTDSATAYADGTRPSETGGGSGADEDLAARLEQLSTCDYGDGQAQTPIGEDDSFPRKSSKYAEALGISPPVFAATTDLQRTKRGRIFSKTKVMFGAKPESIPMVSKRLPSIEAWLDEQPDPFLDQVTEPAEALKSTPNGHSHDGRPQSARNSAGNNPADNKLGLNANEDIHTKFYSMVTGNPYDETGLGISGVDHNADAVGDSDTGSPSHLRRRAARVKRRRGAQIMEDDVQAHPTVAENALKSPTPPPVPPKATYSSIATKEAVKSPPPPPLPPKPGFSPERTQHSSDEQRATKMPETMHDAVTVEATTQERPSLQRRLTTHEDLMSILSLPKTGRSVRAARSTRRQKHRADPKSAKEVLDELTQDEAKYSRELRTLLDGVVPVLLQSALSKADAATAGGLFSSAIAPDDQSMTQQIIAMGISLERLKKLHNRIPFEDVDALLSWAHTAQRAYADYLSSWRLGFQGVVVNLAPAQDNKGEADQIMARDASGDVVDAKGQKVDVAYLLKRPLVRIKTLTKTFRAILARYNVPQAADVVKLYDDLTADARRKHQEEQGRLEDEEVYSIDATKARDVRALTAVEGKVISHTCKVKARDSFDLTMYHSSGQRVDCKVDIILRDERDAGDGAGDMLVCQVDAMGRWLLFPPLARSSVSARKGEDGCDLVIMIRGPAGISGEWHELLALMAEHADVAADWMAMLGSDPLPPRLPRKPSFLNRRRETLLAKSENSTVRVVEEVAPVLLEEVSTVPTTPTIIEPPLGEPSVVNTRSQAPDVSSGRAVFQPQSRPQLSLGGGLQRKSVPEHLSSRADIIQRKPVAAPSVRSSDKSSISDQSTRTGSSYTASSSSRTADTRERVQYSPKAQAPYPVNSGSYASPKPVETPKAQRPGLPRKLSSTPSQALPTISKVRSPETKFSPSTPLTDSIRDQWSVLSGNNVQKDGKLKHSASATKVYTEDIPLPPQHRHNSAPSSPRSDQHNEHTVSSPSTPQALIIPGSSGSKEELRLSPNTKAGKVTKRKSSSPLKHQYEPSSASDSSSGSDSHSEDSDSDTSEDLQREEEDKFTPLVSVQGGRRISSTNWQRPPSTGTRSLAPSDSASQGPCREAAPSSSSPKPKDEKFRSIASVCSWSDKGCWQPLHPDECTILISPGLIEVFETSEYHAQSVTNDETEQRSLQPLVAFELTPIVSLQGGTALDINIRSPSTPNSKIKTSSSTMFRSRTVQEKESLYLRINWARCNNPKYMEMERARPYRQPPVTFDTGAAHTRTKSGSWFRFGGSQDLSDHRASSAPDVSVGGASEASASSAFSMLKRFSANSPFNINRSSVLRKNGRNTGASIYSESSTGKSGSSTPAPSQTGIIPGKDGPSAPLTSADAVNGAGMVNNMKIRLYFRRGQGWQDQRDSLLSVLPAPDPVPASQREEGFHGRTDSQPEIVGRPGQPQGPRLPSSNFTPHRLHGNGREKRILVVDSKNGDKVKLDVVLGESCFERVALRGIVVKVWKESSEIGATGGVLTGTESRYMLQFDNEVQTAWVFGLVSNAGRYH